MAYLPKNRFLSSWKIRSVQVLRPTSDQPRREDLRKSEASGRYDRAGSVGNPSYDVPRRGRVLGSYKKFGDMDVISTTTGDGHQVTLIERHGHLFLNGKEIRLSRDHLVELPDHSLAPVSFQSFYDAAAQCRRNLAPERMIINSSIYRNYGSNSAVIHLKKSVRDVIDKTADLANEGMSKMSKKKNGEGRARFADKKDQLVRSLYALNEGSIRVAEDFTDIAQKMRAKDENTKVLTGAVRQLCEEAIQVSLRDRLATTDARKVKEEMRSLQNENERLRLNLGIKDKALKKCESALDQKLHELSLADLKIVQQRRQIEELNKELQHVEKERIRGQTEKGKLLDEVSKLKVNLLNTKERFNRLEMEKGGQESKLISLQKELEDFRKTLREEEQVSPNIHMGRFVDNGEASDKKDFIQSASNTDVIHSNPMKRVSELADQLSNKLVEAEQLVNNMKRASTDLVHYKGIAAQKFGENFSHFESLHRAITSQTNLVGNLLKLAETVFDNDTGLRQFLTDSINLTKVHQDEDRTTTVTKWREKFKLLAGKTRKYREELGRVSTERDRLKRQKKRLAELVRGGISDRIAVTARVLSLESHHTSRGTEMEGHTQDAQIRHLVKANQELEQKILAKHHGMRRGQETR